MTTDALFDLITTHGSLLALSRHMLGDEWSRGRYQTLAAQVAAGELSGWVAATVAAHAELEELRAIVAALAKETGSAADE